MADGPGPAEQLADKTSQIVVAGAGETWPYRKLMLAVLPPTLALLVAVIGLWESNNRDRAAAAEAEKNRAAAAAEAEDDRVAEAQAQRAIEQREDDLREAELVLPRYEALLADVHVARRSIEQCRRTLNAYLDQVGVIDQVDGTPTPVDPALLQPLPSVPLDRLVAYDVDAAMVSACSQIDAAIEPLQLSLDTALLVSEPALADAALDLTAQLDDVSTQARELLQRVDPTTLKVDVFIDEIGSVWFADGASGTLALLELNLALGSVAPASEAVIESVRGVVLAPG